VTRVPEPGQSAARQVVQAAGFTALGVVVPVLFHMVGIGRHFLPMHLPVLAGGMLLRPGHAVVVGLVTPWLSSALTGMPPMPLPILMSIELVALGGAASLLTAARAPVWIACPLAVLARCAVSWLAMALLAVPLGLPSSASAWLAIVAGAPGILLQIVAVPVLATALRASRRHGGEIA